MRIVSKSIEIRAPSARVWRVLTDFVAYPEWNPFMLSVSGALVVGKKLTVQIKPPGGKEMAFKPTLVAIEPDKELRWLGRLVLPGIFDGEHRFELTARNGVTRFEQSERFSGILVGMLGSTFEKTERGFAAMNEALKQRAES